MKKRKRKNRENKRKDEKKRRKEKEEIMRNYFLLQRTGLEICKLKWLGNFSTMNFLHVHAPLCS
jgi:hypothetical protein